MIRRTCLLAFILSLLAPLARAESPVRPVLVAGERATVDRLASEARLTFGAAIDGRLSVHDRADRLVAEVRKRPGRTVEVAVEPGTYRVSLERDGAVSEASFQVARGAQVEVEPAMLLAVRGDVAATAKREVPVADRFVAVDLGVVPPLSVNGFDRTNNLLSMSVLVGRTTSLHGLGLASILHWADGDVRGVQAAGLGVAAGGHVHGLQLAGTVAVNGRGGGGIQASGLASLVGDRFTGMQLAGGVAWAGGELHGVQAAPLTLATEGVHGLQLGVGNWAAAVDGVQVGVVNVATRVNGTQLGVVNIAGKAKGLMLGLVNYADELDGIPLGLVSVVRNGRFHLEGYWTEAFATNVAMRWGSRQFSTLLFAGGRADRTAWTTGLGFGGRLAWGPFGLDLDVLAGNIHAGRLSPGVNLGGSARALVSFNPLPWLGVFAGPTANVAIGEEAVRVACCSVSRDFTVARAPGRAWLGLTAGVRVF